MRGKNVLEVGCGAGRFTEVMLAAGARVFACDLSSAVEANYANCNSWPEYFVCQADARGIRGEIFHGHLREAPLADGLVDAGVADRSDRFVRRRLNSVDVESNRRAEQCDSL